MIAATQSVLRNYTVPPIARGPRLRLGVVWFVLLLAALLAGSFAVTVLFGVIGGIAGLQVAGQWRHRRVRVNQLIAGAAPPLMALGAWSSLRAAGAAIAAVAVAAVVSGADQQGGAAKLDRSGLSANLPVAAATLRSCLFVGLAVAAVVQVHRVDPMSFLYLMAVACVYDSGNHLIGAGSRNRLVGPVAGLVGVAVVVIAMTAINPPPLNDDGDVRLLGLAMAVACPLGQMLASWTLPATRAKAPALRRLDTWLITAPVCLIGLWLAR